MNLNVYFKSVLEQDTAAVVLCNLEHEIIYMNPAAKARYAKHSGGNLVGKSLLNCHNPKSNEKIEKVVEWFGKARTTTLFTPRLIRKKTRMYIWLPYAMMTAI